MIKATCIDIHCDPKLNVYALGLCYVLDFHVITNCNRVNSFRNTSFSHSYKISRLRDNVAADLLSAVASDSLITLVIIAIKSGSLIS